MLLWGRRFGSVTSLRARSVVFLRFSIGALVAISLSPRAFDLVCLHFAFSRSQLIPHIWTAEMGRKRGATPLRVAGQCQAERAAASGEFAAPCCFLPSLLHCELCARLCVVAEARAERRAKGECLCCVGRACCENTATLFFNCCKRWWICEPCAEKGACATRQSNSLAGECPRCSVEVAVGETLLCPQWLSEEVLDTDRVLAKLITGKQTSDHERIQEQLVSDAAAAQRAADEEA